MTPTKQAFDAMREALEQALKAISCAIHATDTYKVSSRGDFTSKVEKQIVAALAAAKAVEPQPERQWIDLTDEEIMEIRALKDGRPYGTFELCKAICAALKAKNAQPERQPLTDDFLQANDYLLLDRFIETTEDGEGYDITKTEIKRLSDLGVVQSHGFGKYSATMFGYWAHERYWKQNPNLPLKTNADRDAEAAHGITSETGKAASAPASGITYENGGQ